ncbi:MAG: Maf family protein [Anaerolineales bacterium]|jgi:MAF protein
MLVLASGSPRRQALLSILGLQFQVQTSEADETLIHGESPQDYVLRLAITKSKSIPPLTPGRRVVIAADTAVVDGKQILGKPANREQAINMLEQLCARTHSVLSGIAVRDILREETYTELCITQVLMRNYTKDEIRTYVASGDPMDKAGAYAIQNTDFKPVAQISGCYANVVGLPLCHLAKLLERVGIPYDKGPIQGCRSGQSYNCRLIERITALDIRE